MQNDPSQTESSYNDIVSRLRLMLLCSVLDSIFNEIRMRGWEEDAAAAIHPSLSSIANFCVASDCSISTVSFVLSKNKISKVAPLYRQQVRGDL